MLSYKQRQERCECYNKDNHCANTMHDYLLFWTTIVSANMPTLFLSCSLWWILESLSVSNNGSGRDRHKHHGTQ